MAYTQKQIKKILLNSKFKGDIEKDSCYLDKVENLSEKLVDERNPDYLIFLNAILKKDEKKFSDSLNSIKNNQNIFNVNINEKSDKIINISKTLISLVKSKGDLELLNIAVKSGFFDNKNKDFYTPRSIDMINRYGSKETKELIKGFSQKKRKVKKCI